MDTSLKGCTDPFSVRVLRDGTQVWVCLHGELDMTGVNCLERQVDTLLVTEPVPADIGIELSRLDFVDVIGGRALGRACSRLRRSAPVHVHGCRRSILRTLDLVGVRLPADAPLEGGEVLDGWPDGR